MGRWSKRNRQDTIKDEIYSKLSIMFREGKGRARYEDKKLGLDKRYIYSSSTYHTYSNECQNFRKWIKENHPECKHLKACRKWVNEWLQALIREGKSAHTISTRKAALAKLFQVDYSYFVETPGRYRKNTVRSRLDVAYDKHISAKTEAYWSKITSATGLRLAELLRVRGTDIFLKDGIYYLHVKKGTKGGKHRIARVLDPEVAEMIKLSGDRPAFPNVPRAFDNHHYRAVYAQRLYNLHARPVEDIPKEDRYIMRKDRKGVVLDKQAMLTVSVSMGHNRISVIAQAYLY